MKGLIDKAIIAIMKPVSVSELKNRLSHYLRLVKRGGTIEIVERSTPVARLTGIGGRTGNGAGHLARLVREGIVSPARGKPPADLLDRPPVPCSGDAVQVLIEQRGDR